MRPIGSAQQTFIDGASLIVSGQFSAQAAKGTGAGKPAYAAGGVLSHARKADSVSGCKAKLLSPSRCQNYFLL